jgi:hypothetical protein
MIGRMNTPMMKGFATVDPASDAVVREVAIIAKEQGRLRTRQAAVIPIIGASKLAQFEDNLRSLNVTLSSEQCERLDKVSAVPPGFPYGGLRDRIKV